MMDGLIPQNLDFSLDETKEVGLALFPGSRKATYQVLPRLLKLSQMLAKRLGKDICAFIAVAPSIDTEKLAQACSDFTLGDCPYPGWHTLTDKGEANAPRARFFLIKGHLADVLQYSQVALGLAGTAHEQAAGWGIPVVAYEPGGMSHLKWYRARQKGLLGDSLIVSEDRDADIVEALCNLVQDKAERQRRAEVGRKRLGPPGGSERMAAIIAEACQQPS